MWKYTELQSPCCTRHDFGVSALLGHRIPCRRIPFWSCFHSWTKWWRNPSKPTTASAKPCIRLDPWKCKTDCWSMGCRRTLSGRFFPFLEALGWMEWALPWWYAPLFKRRWLPCPDCCSKNHRFSWSVRSCLPRWKCFHQLSHLSWWIHALWSVQL